MLTLKMDRVEPACVYLQLSLGLLSRETKANSRNCPYERR